MPDVVLVLAMLILGVWRFWPQWEVVAQNGDAGDYAWPAINFVEGKGIVHIAHGVKYPPEHAVGLALMMSPFFAVFGGNIENGIWPVFLCALGSVVLLYSVVRQICNRTAAIAAGLLLILSPLFTSLTNTIGPEVPSACLGLVALSLLLGMLRRRHSPWWQWILLALVLGYIVLLRPDNLLFMVPVGITLLAIDKRQERIGIAPIFCTP